MATHYGNIINSTVVENPNLLSPVVEYSPFENIFGVLSKNIADTYVSNHGGMILNGNPGETVCEGKIYVSPTYFSYDLITEEITENIRIWNADNIAHTLYSVSISGGTSGISFDIGSTPKIFTPETSKDFVLTIFKDGPAIQNNVITLTFDTITYTISIYGVRIKSFPYDAHYDSLSIDYSIKSVIFENEHFQEQRRPIHLRVLREENVNFLFNEKYGKRFVNDVRGLINKVLGIPVYSEPINQVTEELHGLSNFSVEENLSDYWNLHDLFNYLIFIDIQNNVGELKEILSYSSSSITLKYPIVGYFAKNTTLIYPAIIGIISEKPTIEAVTNQVISTSVKFREIVL